MRRGLAQAGEIVRATGFRSSARQAETTKRLHTDHGANLIAIDVQIADSCSRSDVCDAGINAAVKSHSQAEPKRVDPINDLIERFSAVMLVAASSLGLQALLLNITGWWGVSAFLVAAAVVFLVTIWAPESPAADYAGPALRVLLMILFVRFAVPVLIVGTTLISDAFLVPEQQAATAVLESTTADIEEMNEETKAVAPGDQSFMDRIGDMIDDSLESMQVRERLVQLKDSAARASEHIVSLIAIFVLQTIILPLAFLWLFVEGLKAIASRSTRIFSDT